MRALRKTLGGSQYQAAAPHIILICSPFGSGSHTVEQVAVAPKLCLTTTQLYGNSPPRHTRTELFTLCSPHLVTSFIRTTPPSTLTILRVSSIGARISQLGHQACCRQCLHLSAMPSPVLPSSHHRKRDSSNTDFQPSSKARRSCHLCLSPHCTSNPNHNHTPHTKPAVSRSAGTKSHDQASASLCARP